MSYKVSSPNLIRKGSITLTPGRIQDFGLEGRKLFSEKGPLIRTILKGEGGGGGRSPNILKIQWQKDTILGGLRLRRLRPPPPPPGSASGLSSTC